MHRPTTEAELAGMIAGAQEPLHVIGGATRGVGAGGAPLSTVALSGITLYEPGAMTLVAQAGTPVAEIEAVLARENQRLAFEPMDHRALLGRTGTPTIGGVMAANVSGPRRISVGAARDFLLGVRYVDGMGQAVKNGGRVMKNVTGYDLVKLMAGSFGTLGVLSEISMKVLPCPETEATLILHGLDDLPAITALARALGSPFEVTGAAHDPAAGQTALRIEGFSSSVDYRIGALKSLLSAPVMTVLDADASAAHWAMVRDVTPFAQEAGDVWRVSCKPSQGPALAARSGALGVLYDWAGGLIWLRMARGGDLRSALGSYDGHATLVRGDSFARFEPESAGVARLTSGLRKRFDPRRIFNPGVMG